MSHWNYRIIKRRVLEEDSYHIHEVYYDDEGVPDACTMDASSPFGETLEELKNDLNYMMNALNKPIIEYSYFEDLANKKEKN